MSHPFRVDFNKLVRELIEQAQALPRHEALMPVQQRETLRLRLEAICQEYACIAAGVAGNDADRINRMVWYRDDGWDHGGSAISWEERAQELETRVKAAEELIENIRRLNCPDGQFQDLEIEQIIKE